MFAYSPQQVLIPASPTQTMVQNPVAMVATPGIRQPPQMATAGTAQPVQMAFPGIRQSPQVATAGTRQPDQMTSTGISPSVQLAGAGTTPYIQSHREYHTSIGTPSANMMVVRSPGIPQIQPPINVAPATPTEEPSQQPPQSDAPVSVGLTASGQFNDQNNLLENAEE